MLNFLRNNQIIFVVLLLVFSGFVTLIILNEDGKIKFLRSLYHRKFDKLDNYQKIKDLQRSIDMIRGLPNEHPYRQNRLIYELEEERDALLKKLNKD